MIGITKCGSQTIDQDKLEGNTHLGLSLDVNILSLSEESAGIFTICFRKRTTTTYLNIWHVNPVSYTPKYILL